MQGSAWRRRVWLWSLLFGCGTPFVGLSGLDSGTPDAGVDDDGPPDGGIDTDDGGKDTDGGRDGADAGLGRDAGAPRDAGQLVDGGCPPGARRCGSDCIGPTECCASSDCPRSGPCLESATCSATHRCESAPMPAGSPCPTDGNPCTDDECNGAGVCQHLGNDAGCSDGLACTSDRCVLGRCVGTPGGGCQPLGPCYQVSGCLADGGCSQVRLPAGSPCTDDLQPCTSDVCDNAGNCLHRPLDAGTLCTSDQNPCTDDVCGADGGCLHLANARPCNFGGDRCTNGYCDAGVCLRIGPRVCDDGITCTENRCDAGEPMGCFFPPRPFGTPCDDGNPCSTNDFCTVALCRAGPPLQCDDGNACTADSCNPAVDGGCVRSPLTGPACSDGNPCTLNDNCQAGVCRSGSPVICNDGNPCTIDFCSTVDGGCQFAPVPQPATCNDGLMCTSSDQCMGGYCVGTNTCAGGASCTPGGCSCPAGLLALYCQAGPNAGCPSVTTSCSDPQCGTCGYDSNCNNASSTRQEGSYSYTVVCTTVNPLSTACNASTPFYIYKHLNNFYSCNKSNGAYGWRSHTSGTGVGGVSCLSVNAVCTYRCHPNVIGGLGAFCDSTGAWNANFSSASLAMHGCSSLDPIPPAYGCP